MKKFCVIGNPIDHSLSPKLHNFWFKKNKINATYEKKLLKDEEIPEIVKDLRKTDQIKMIHIYLSDYLAQNIGVRITNNVNISSRPNNIANASVPFANVFLFE